jgi:hypothetical protein
LRVEGSGLRGLGGTFGASGFGFRVSVFRFRVSSFGFRVSCCELRIVGHGFRGSGSRFGVWDSGLSVSEVSPVSGGGRLRGFAHAWDSARGFRVVG